MKSCSKIFVVVLIFGILSNFVHIFVWFWHWVWKHESFRVIFYMIFNTEIGYEMNEFILFYCFSFPLNFPVKILQKNEKKNLFCLFVELQTSFCTQYNMAENWSFKHLSLFFNGNFNVTNGILEYCQWRFCIRSRSFLVCCDVVSSFSFYFSAASFFVAFFLFSLFVLLLTIFINFLSSSHLLS